MLVNKVLFIIESVATIFILLYNQPYGLRRLIIRLSPTTPMVDVVNQSSIICMKIVSSLICMKIVNNYIDQSILIFVSVVRVVLKDVMLFLSSVPFQHTLPNITQVYTRE